MSDTTGKPPLALVPSDEADAPLAELSADARKFVDDGAAAVRAELAKQPFRVVPTFDDIVAAVRGMLLHVVTRGEAGAAAAEAEVKAAEAKLAALRPALAAAASSAPGAVAGAPTASAAGIVEPAPEPPAAA